MLLVLLVFLLFNLGLSILPHHEILALKDIYDHTDASSWFWGSDDKGPRWFNNNSSNSNTSESEFDSEVSTDVNPCNDGGLAWQGVRCSGTPTECDTQLCTVIYLQLPNFNINGRFFHPSLGNLTNLQVLNMFSNPALSGSLPTTIAAASLLFYMDFTGCAVTGSLPSVLGDLTDMWRFKFRDNSLTGSLPGSLTRQTGLEVLELRGNYLNGTLPLSYSSLVSLKVLDLKFNKLTGSIPNEYSKMIGLNNFELYSNMMTGTIPNSFGELTNLQVLDFDYNFMHGTIPSELGNLIDMRRLYFYGNRFTGNIPVSFGNLTRLVELDLGAIDLDGTIPSQLGQLVHLKTLYVDDNILLTGSIPSELGNLASIIVFWMHDNHLSSSLPLELGNLTTAKSMTFFRNFLTGSIPLEFSHLTSLSLLTMHANEFTGSPFPSITPLSGLITLWLDSNLFTGSLGIQIQDLQQLTHLRLQNNLFSQKLPSSLVNCSRLQLLELENNQFTSSIPASLGQLRGLVVLKLGENHFTGTVPYLGNLSVIEDLVLRGNAFTGDLTFGLERFQYLEFFDISANQFSGNLAVEVGLGSLLAVTQMYIQGNLFSSSLEGVFTQPQNMSVVYLDFSDNRFSGSIPGSIFQMPSVSVIALSLNCFEGSLPIEMCNANEVKVLSMDGLGAATNCAHSFTVPFSHIAMFNKLEGSIPECVFSMPSLQFLHLTGNGLTGTLASLPNASNIDHLHLSHNQLTSTIPLSFLRNSFIELDLSYNKITGKYQYPLIQANSSISLEINRLSGSLDVEALETASTISILRDNIFSCQHLPHNDLHHEKYSCGSTTLNDAYYFLAVVSMLVVVFVMAIIAVRVHAMCSRHWNWLEESSQNTDDVMKLDEESRGSQTTTATTTSNVISNNNSNNTTTTTTDASSSNIAIDFYETSHLRKVNVLMKNIQFYLHYCDRHLEASDESLRHIKTYSRELKTFSTYLLMLSAICVVSVLPILVLKYVDQNSAADNEYVTHANVYNWQYSLAFITGELPACLLLCAWAVSCSAFIFFVIRTLKTHSNHLLGRQRSKSSIVQETVRRVSMRRSDFLAATKRSSASNSNSNNDSNRKSSFSRTSSFLRGSVPRGSSLFAMESLNRDSITSTSTTSSDEPTTSSSQKKEKLAAKIRRHLVISSIGLMIFNTGVVSVVNGMYIIYSPKVSPFTAVMFQFALALFNVMYSIFIIPALTVGFSRHSDAINMRIKLLVINSLVIPCIVTAITSPSCIQGIFVKPDDVTASYVYTPDCAITQYSHTGEPICTDTNDIYVDVAALTPPFSYNYQCTSVILTAYIPVFIYTYSLQVIAPFIFLFLLCFIKYTTLPRPFRKTVPGILFPDNWSKDSTGQGFRSDMLQIALSKRLYNIKTVTSNLIHNIIILLTFGICSPVLACLIGASSYLIIAMWRILIARFVHYRLTKLTSSATKKKHQQDYSLASMGALAGEAKGLIRLCLWPYVSVSAFFFLCLTWDMSGDRVGWRAGLWAPLVSLSVLSVMYLAVCLYTWCTSPMPLEIEGHVGVGVGVGVSVGLPIRSVDRGDRGYSGGEKASSGRSLEESDVTVISATTVGVENRDQQDTSSNTVTTCMPLPSVTHNDANSNITSCDSDGGDRERKRERGVEVEVEVEMTTMNPLSSVENPLQQA